MHTVDRKGSNGLTISMSGKMNSEQMKKALDDLVKQLDGITSGRMLHDVTGFDRLLSRLWWSGSPSSRQCLGFRENTVFTGKTWLKRISEFEGSLIQGLEIRVFNHDEKEVAESWLA